MQVHSLLAAVKSKCSPEEAAQILKDLPNPLKDDDSKISDNFFLKSIPSQSSDLFNGQINYYYVIRLN